MSDGARQFVLAERALPRFVVVVDYRSQQIQPGAKDLLDLSFFFNCPLQVSVELLSKLQGTHVHRFSLLLESQFIECLGVVLMPP
jgi:hypothetical protein